MDIVKQNGVFAVIRGQSAAAAYELADACIEGGLKLIEITFSFIGAENVIRALSQRDGVIVGAGTVLDLYTAEAAVGAGAKFIISPHTDREIISYAKSRDVLVVQGALTPSEIINALKLGADMAKIFPAKAVGGHSYIKALKEPLPSIEVMATGGITIENFADYLSAGAAAVGLSSALTGGAAHPEPETVYLNARRVLQMLKENSE